MKPNLNSLPEQKVLSLPQTEVTRTEAGPFIVLEIPGRLPSWNDILGMEQWTRYQFKEKLAHTFLSELRAIAQDCSMKTICAKSTIATYADTLESYLLMRREQRRLKFAKRKLEKANPNLFESKSSKQNLPF